jgi:4-amino-4-deoxy-L-arabinose transferase-like glycosyltransferase
MTSQENKPSFFFPSYQSSKDSKYHYLPFLILIVFLSCLGLLVYSTIHLDHPFGLSTLSRALYVDEGFYTDAAQNAVKFDQWMFPLDSRHWPGAPFMALSQYLAFSLFGVSIETARMTSVMFSLVSGLAIYSIARASLTPAISLMLAVAGLLSIGFIGHARAAIPDPIATCCALLAFLVYIRVRSRSFAIPVSIILAFLAFFSKMYFLSVLASVIFLWSVELFVLPKINKSDFDRKAILTFLLTLFLLGASYLLYFYIFRFEITIFRSINSNKMPYLDVYYFYLQIRQSLSVFTLNTKTNVILVVLALSIVYFIASSIWSKSFKAVPGKLKNIGRAEYAISTWLIAGILLIGILQAHKSHYHFFAILPILFLGTVSLKLVFPERFYTAVMSMALIGHLMYQLPFYIKWEQRENKTAVYDASVSIVEQVLKQDKSRIVPVIGEYSAQLGLFSDRIMSLDAKWVSQATLCDRLNYWRPQFHVNVVWPKSMSKNERYKIKKCAIVSHTRVMANYPVFAEWQDEIVLSRIVYNK